MFEAFSQNEPFNRALKGSKNWILVPVPLHSSRFRTRGYNHAEILAKELGKKFKIKVQNVIKRVKDTKSSYGLKLAQRKKNIKGAFTSSEVGVLNIFIVDDIVTSGSTLLEAANILKRNGAKRVYGITLARD